MFPLIISVNISVLEHKGWFSLGHKHKSIITPVRSENTCDISISISVVRYVAAVFTSLVCA